MCFKQDDRRTYAINFIDHLVSWHAVTSRMMRAEAFVNLGEPKIPVAWDASKLNHFELGYFWSKGNFYLKVSFFFFIKKRAFLSWEIKIIFVLGLWASWSFFKSDISEEALKVLILKSLQQLPAAEA